MNVKSDPIQCDIIPIMTAESGLVGHCCMFKKVTVNGQKQDKFIENVFKNYYSNNVVVKNGQKPVYPVEPEYPQRPEPIHISFNKPITINTERPAVTEEDFYHKKLQTNLPVIPVTEQMGSHPRMPSSTQHPSTTEEDVIIDNRFNIDSPKGCKSGTKTSDGNCEVAFG